KSAAKSRGSRPPSTRASSPSCAKPGKRSEPSAPPRPMTAPLFHLQPGALDTAAPGSVLTLEGAEGHHAATVMRLDEGEHIQLADTVATKAEGLIQAVAPGRLEV